jgi:hypothetical protein
MGISMAQEDSNNYLYIGKRKSGEIGYVGIGGVTRPYGDHSDEADRVLRDGEVWVTQRPFSTRQDAEMAESLLIQALTWATETEPCLANIAKVNYSKYVSPALPYRDGLLKYSDTRNALFVKIRPGQLKGRTAPHGESGDIDLTMRCNRWWPLGRAQSLNKNIKYLIAVTAHVKPPRVIGVWETRPVADWWYEDQSAPEKSRISDDPWNSAAPAYDINGSGWVATVMSSSPNINQWQGLEFDWEGYKPQNVGYSPDIR